MLLSELLTEAVAKKLEPITITKQEDGRWEIATKAKTMPTVGVIATMIRELVTKHKTKVVMSNAAGKVMSEEAAWAAIRNKPSRFFATSEKMTDDRLEELLTKLRDKGIREEEAHAKAVAKRKSPEYKKEVAAVRNAASKEKTAEMEQMYGKDTWKSITYKQEGGDDGYQYVVRVKGKAVESGLTQREAMAKKKSLANEIAKKNKTGKYAD